MANDEYRDQHEAAREAGLAARHETRVERAIRRQVAEEIAQALEKDARQCPPKTVASGAFERAARIAREIGAKETS